MSARAARVLVVDDEPAVRSALRVNLARAGYDVALASSAEEALRGLREKAADVVLTDVTMPGAGGLHLLETLRQDRPELPVILMTGHGSVESAVAAMKAGASDYIIKPVSKDELLVILERTLRERALLAEVRELREVVAQHRGFEKLVGATPAMRRVYALVAAVAESDALVLLTGPTGTGKELLAQAIHERSPRKDRPFVRVNCAALPEGLLESELFGHEKGAFTGAFSRRDGRFRQADGGTLLLDEVSEIPLPTQVKLLRFLQERTFERVGGNETLKVDVRILAASNRDLKQQIEAGKFREDLYYRLNVVSIAIPPLRERKGDIPALAAFFLRRYAEENGKKLEGFSDEALADLSSHPWPGNVRELENAIERAVVLADGARVERRHLPTSVARIPEGETAPKIPGSSIADLEKWAILRTLEACGGSTSRAATILGISARKIQYKLHEYSGGAPAPVSVRTMVDDEED